MSTLTGFFKGPETHLGVFYPRHYLIAVFPDLEAARCVEKRLLNAGFTPDDVTAVSGREMAAEHARNHGFFAMLMQQLSRVFETEEVYADKDVSLALKGAAFLLTYCPSEIRKNEAWSLIEPGGPLMARHYAFGGVEHLVGET